MKKSLQDFRYMTFDVVGTLIDFERGLVDCLSKLGAESGIDVDGEAALELYRAARYEADAGLFPDDLERVYVRIAPALGLPATPGGAMALRQSVRDWRPFSDSVAALASLAKSHRLIAMTNAQRWAFDMFDVALGRPFHSSFTVDETGTEKPDPAFFRHVQSFVEAEGGSVADILHVAQSQYHDIGPSRRLGWVNCWIQRRRAQTGYGGTIAPENFTEPDLHFTSLAALAAAVADASPSSPITGGLP